MGVSYPTTRGKSVSKAPRVKGRPLARQLHDRPLFLTDVAETGFLTGRGAFSRLVYQFHCQSERIIRDYLKVSLRLFCESALLSN